MQESKELLKVDDLFTASGLKVLGLKFIDTQKNFNRVIFIFEGGLPAKEAMQKFLNDYNGVRSTLSTYRDLKNLIFKQE